MSTSKLRINNTDHQFIMNKYKELFLYILAMRDQNIIDVSAAYIDRIINCYKSEFLCSSVLHSRVG